MKSSIAWEVFRRFEVTCCLHLQVRRMSIVRKQLDTLLNNSKFPNKGNKKCVRNLELILPHATREA
jgi:hypothetical protein